MTVPKFRLATITLLVLPPAAAQDTIYWTQTGPGGFMTNGPTYVMKANADGSGVTQLVSVLDRIELYGGYPYDNLYALSASLDGGTRQNIKTGGYRLEPGLTQTATVNGQKYGAVHVAANPAPVPEPETYAQMLAGLCLVGFAARRVADAAESRMSGACPRCLAVRGRWGVPHAAGGAD